MWHCEGFNAKQSSVFIVKWGVGREELNAKLFARRTENADALLALLGFLPSDDMAKQAPPRMSAPKNRTYLQSWLGAYIADSSYSLLSVITQSYASADAPLHFHGRVHRRIHRNLGVGFSRKDVGTSREAPIDITV